MREPKYNIQIVAWVSFFVGICFFVLAMVSSYVFPSLSIPLIFLRGYSIYDIALIIFYSTIFLSAALRIKARAMERQFQDTLSDGDEIEGEVINIIPLKHLKFFSKNHAYQIEYSYYRFGETPIKKSHYIWYEPELSKGDIIYVYVEKDGSSAINF